MALPVLKWRRTLPSDPENSRDDTNQEPTGLSWLENIPFELLWKILEQLSPEDREMLAYTSKSMRASLHPFRPTTVKIPLSYVLQSPALLEWARLRHYPTNRMIHKLLEFGDADVLKIWRNEGVPWTKNYLSAIAQHGNTGLVQWAYNEGAPMLPDTLSSAAKSGNLELVKWAHSKGAPILPDTLSSAAKSGNLELVQWFFADPSRLSAAGLATFFEAAVESDHTHIVFWAMGLTGRESNCVNTHPRMCAVAADNGNLGMLMCLRGFRPDGTRFTENVCSWDKQTTAAAARINRFDMLKWARGYNRDGSETDDPCPWDDLTCMYAAQHGNLDMLVWARAHRCPWKENVTMEAATHGHLDVLMYLRGYTPDGQQTGDVCPWDHMCLAFATKHTKLCKWAREHGCPWNGPLMSASAAKNGNLDLVKYNYDNELGWDENTCTFAATHGHLEILKWARDHGYPWNTLTMEGAVEKGHLEVLEYAFSKGCPISWDTICANIPIMQCLADNNALHWNRRSLSNIIKNGDFAAFKWALKHGYPWFFQSLVHITLVGDSDIFRYALRHRVPRDSYAYCAVPLSQLDTVVKRLYEYGVPWSDNASRYFAEAGRLDLIQYARRRGCPWDIRMLNTAITCGHLDIVQWVMWWPDRPFRLEENIEPEEYIEPDESTRRALYDCEHVDVLNWCYDHNLQWLPHKSHAAERGLVSVIEWAISRNIKLYPDFLEGAIRHNQIFVVELLLRHGLRPEKSLAVIIELARNGKLEMLKRMLAFNRDNSKMPFDSGDCPDTVTYNVPFEVFDWARKHGCPWSPFTAYETAIRRRDSRLLAWLIDDGCPLPDTGSAKDPATWLVENDLIVYDRTHQWDSKDQSDAYVQESDEIQLLLQTYAKGLNWATTLDMANVANINVLKFLIDKKCPVTPVTNVPSSPLASILFKTKSWVDYMLALPWLAPQPP